MWAIYHHRACLFSPHWAIGVGQLSRILIAGSTLTDPANAWRQRDKTGKSNSQPMLCLLPPSFQPSPFHLLRSVRRGRVGVIHVRWCWCVGVCGEGEHTNIGCWISKRRQEGVCHMRGGTRSRLQSSCGNIFQPSNCQWKRIDHCWAPKQTFTLLLQYGM